MRLPVPIGLVCVPIACIAMWLTTAVVQAQGDAPGITQAAVQQVAKPVVAHVAAVGTSRAATAQQAASKASAAQQGTAHAATLSHSAPKAVPTVTVPVADVPVTPPQIAVAAPPMPLAELSPLPDVPAAPNAPQAVDVPTLVATTLDESEAAADAAVAEATLDDKATVNDAGALAETASVADIAAVVDAAPSPPVAALETDAVVGADAAAKAKQDEASQHVAQVVSDQNRDVGSSAVGHLLAAMDQGAEALPIAQVDSAIETAFAPHTPGVDDVSPIVAAAEPSEPNAPIPSTESTPWPPLASASAQRTLAEQLTRGASIAPSTVNARGTSEASARPIEPFDAKALSTPIAPNAAQLRYAAQPADAGPVKAPSAVAGADQWDMPGAVRELRLMDDRGARTLAAERSQEFGAGRSALAPSAVLAVPNTALAFDSLRSRPTDHTRSPLESLAPPGVASSLPAQGSPSSVLGGSGGTPGAASPMQLSVLLMTAWRSLVRQSVSHPAIIALAHLAPPG